MGCEGFNTCYGFNCGGGAVEQSAMGYDSAGGLHPKCQLPPSTMQFEVEGWVGTLAMVGSMSEIARAGFGCQHSNCTCVDPQCQCYGTDLAGNTNFMGHMTAENCHSRGYCLSPDMTVQGCCEDPVTGAKPTKNAGFGWDLNPEECDCRGGTWSTGCAMWTQDQLDSCDTCIASCPPYKIGSATSGFTYDKNPDGGPGECEGVGRTDPDGNHCCCAGDSPKCDFCPNHCVVWQGVTENTCGPPVLFGPEEDPGKGYGITYPWEVTLICNAPAKTAHGYKQGDFGSWELRVTAWYPQAENRLFTEPCKSWTFSNVHGNGDLDIGSMCQGGEFSITAELDLVEDEVATRCERGCPCFEQVSNVYDGEECDCSEAECLQGGPHGICSDGTSDPPDCDTTCLVPKPACPAVDLIWENMKTSIPPEPTGDGKHVQDWCHMENNELLGLWKYKEDECGVACALCDYHCADGCVCETEEGLVGPSSLCGILSGSNRNTEGHGCSKDPKLSFEGDPNKEGMCCNPGYFEDCVEATYYQCGCLSQETVDSGKTTINITAAATSPPLTDIGGIGSDGYTPVGKDEPGEIQNICEPVDAICDWSNKHPPTNGCRYTQYPSASCAPPLPIPDHSQGVRCPTSLVYDPEAYGLQCVLPGGSNNGPGNWDFDVKPVGACLNARSERWHLRPQFTHPHLWAICHPAGHDGTTPPCDQPADRDLACIEHPEVTRFIGDIANIHGNLSECNMYCEGWWEVVVDCTRAWVLGLCEACLGDCWEDRVLMDADPWPTGGACPKSDKSSDQGCDKKWPGEFPFLYYHPPIKEFCPYGEYFPAIGCPSVPNSPAAAIHGGSAQLFYPGNIETQWNSCCGNQPAGCRCCYPCGHPAYDPKCRVQSLINGSICDVCWECMCTSTTSMQGYTANQIYNDAGCPNGCTHDGEFMSGQCVQVVQDGGNEVAGCGQFMQEIPDICEVPVFCPEGLIPYDKYGGGFCIEGDMCCQCLRTKGDWVKNNSLVGPTTNPLGWKLGAPELYDMAWYPLKDAVCMLEPCGMGESSEGVAGLTFSGAPVLYDKGAIKVSMTLMREGTSTEVGEALKIHDHQSMGDIIGVTKRGEPIEITTRLQVGQLEVNLSPGDPIFIGQFNDSQGNIIGSQVEGIPSANGQFEVISISGNSFRIRTPGGGPVIANGTYKGGGTWFYYDPTDSGASCNAPSTSCAFDFKFMQGGTNVGTSPKVLPESLFIECVEEAFIEWGHIIESLWSPHADYSAVDKRHGSWSPTVDGHPFPGRDNNNPGLPDHASSHQLRFRFVNLGHENPEASVVPSNKEDRYEAPQWRGITNYPEIGNCVHKGNNPSAPDTPEPIWKNMGECITHGYCLDKGCSANDMRQQVIRGHDCPYNSNPNAGNVYLTPKACLDAKYYACLTRPKYGTPEFGHGAVRTIGGEDFGYPKKTFDAEGNEIFIPTVPRSREWLDPQYIIPDIGSAWCCANAHNRETGEIGGFWTQIDGDWSTDYGNGSGIWNPGTKGRTPCVPKSAECCQGTVPCAQGIQNHFIPPTNEHTPANCCIEYEMAYGQCLGDPDLDGDQDELYNSGYEECAYGESGWCVDSNGTVLWNSEQYGGGRKACEGQAGGSTSEFGCIEQRDTCDYGTCVPVLWQSTQRVITNDIAATTTVFELSLKFGDGDNVGNPLEKTDCDNNTNPIFIVPDWIKIGNEYMEITQVNTSNNTITVIRGASVADASPKDSTAVQHSAGASISLASSTTNCDDTSHCEDADGNLIADANTGIAYFPIDNRSLYQLCRDGDRQSVYSPTCGGGGSCWIAGETGVGSSRGVPIGISSLYHGITEFATTIRITEIDNTGALWRDLGDDTHDPSTEARPESFQLQANDIIRIEGENMRVVSVSAAAGTFHADVKGDCTADVKLNGLFGAATTSVPECEFIDCGGGDTVTDCRHWFNTGNGTNCAGESLGSRSWPDDIVQLYDITVVRGVDGTTAKSHSANIWVRKKYGDVVADCRQCYDNLGGVPIRHKWGRSKFKMGGWRPAWWNTIFDWQAHTWDAQVDYDMPFYGKTGGQCLDWPEDNDCCPRIGQVRIGMVNWYDALRERWAAEGKGQCYDCNTGVIVGGQTTFGPNSVELHGECQAYQEDSYDKTLVGLTGLSQENCLALNAQNPHTEGKGFCTNNNYITKTDCISNGEVWLTWQWSAYINKDICNNAGHCWDYRDPPLVPASGNPFACGHMGGMRCLKNHEGVWIPCIPESKPYAKANNALVGEGGCVGFRPAPDSNVIPALPGGGDPPAPAADGGEPCVCITQGKEGIAGDLYIDSSVKWRPDWVPEYDKPGAWSIKRVLMKQIGHMLGLPNGMDVMSPISGPSEDAVPVGPSTYNKLVEMYEPSWWNRGGTNDYWWVSGIYAGDF